MRKMDAGEGPEMDACSVEPVPLPIMTTSRSSSNVSHVERPPEKHVIKGDLVRVEGEELPTERLGCAPLSLSCLTLDSGRS